MKIIVTHSGLQHSPRLAYALHKKNRLKKFYVGYYFKDNVLFSGFIKLLGNNQFNKIIKKRYIPGVNFDNNNILTFPFFSFSMVFLHSFFRKIGIYNTSKLTYLGNIVFDFLISVLFLKKEDTAIVSYLNTALRSFRKIKKNGGLCVLDYATIHFDTIDRILKDERSLSPEFLNQLQDDNKPKMSRIRLELQLADRVIVPSNFCKFSMEENGVDSNKIVVVPYGANFFSIPKENFKNYYFGDVLSVLFVGQIQQRKGIKYLLQSVETLQRKGLNVNLKLVGTIYGCEEAINEFECFEHIPFLDKEELGKLMMESHILVLPTLYDSFGLVTLEAMALGLLPIVSENAGSKDVIDSDSGFIVPIRDSDRISRTIEHLYYNSKELNEKRKNAIRKASEYSWERYYDSIAAIFDLKD